MIKANTFLGVVDMFDHMDILQSNPDGLIGICYVMDVCTALCTSSPIISIPHCTGTGQYSDGLDTLSKIAHTTYIGGF